MTRHHFMVGAQHVVPVSLTILLLLASCGPIVPATTPPNLEFTPGAPVVVHDDRFSGPVFSAQIPSGWRVVTGAADEASKMVLVAPDEISTITLQTGDIDLPLDDDFHAERETISLDDGTIITAIGRAPSDSWDSFQEDFARVIESVK